jgi:SAM-dependent methyltransferase
MTEGVWDSWYRKKLGTIEPEIPTLVKLLKEAKLKRVLDVGCGTGRHVAYLALDGFETWGFDATESALARAKKLLSEKNLKADLTLGNMFEPFPYDDGFFGVVIATRVIQHGYISSIRKVAREINRVLARSGYMFIQLSAWLPGEKIESPTVVEVEPRTLIWTEGEEANIPHHHFTKEELLEMFPDHEVIDLHARSEHYSGWCLLTRKVG